MPSHYDTAGKHTHGSNGFPVFAKVRIRPQAQRAVFVRMRTPAGRVTWN